MYFCGRVASTSCNYLRHVIYGWVMHCSRRWFVETPNLLELRKGMKGIVEKERQSASLISVRRQMSSSLGICFEKCSESIQLCWCFEVHILSPLLYSERFELACNAIGETKLRGSMCKTAFAIFYPIVACNVLQCVGVNVLTAFSRFRPGRIPGRRACPTSRLDALCEAMAPWPNLINLYRSMTLSMTWFGPGPTLAPACGVFNTAMLFLKPRDERIRD